MARQTELVALIWLSVCALTMLPFNLHAEPISSPEIASKSIKSNNNNNLQQQQIQQQHQQQQQQQNDAHLNSLAVYATNYDSIASAQVQPSASNSAAIGSSSSASATSNGAATATAAGINQAATNGHFKPSYRLPEMETNFTPLHSQSSNAAAAQAALANLQATPMLMQYLPTQTLQDGSINGAGSIGGGGTANGGVQYLQLIPTRPIIVPISPYLAPNGGPPPPSAYASLSPTVGAAGGNTLADYGQPTLTSPHRGVSVGVGTSALMPFANAAGLHAYANSIVPYRPSPASVGGGGHHHAHHFHRFNREAKDKHFPHAMSLNLNLNEYLPATHEAASRAGGIVYMRGRP